MDENLFIRLTRNPDWLTLDEIKDKVDATDYWAHVPPAVLQADSWLEATTRAEVPTDSDVKADALEAASMARAMAAGADAFLKWLHVAWRLRLTDEVDRPFFGRVVVGAAVVYKQVALFTPEDSERAIRYLKERGQHYQAVAHLVEQLSIPTSWN